MFRFFVSLIAVISLAGTQVLAESCRAACDTKTSSVTHTKSADLDMGNEMADCHGDAQSERSTSQSSDRHCGISDCALVAQTSNSFQVDEVTSKSPKKQLQVSPQAKLIAFINQSFAVYSTPSGPFVAYRDIPVYLQIQHFLN